MKWLEDNRVQVDISRTPKKLTGTRLAAALGLNPWVTPFETWCEITRTYQKPFEDTIYTIAGKTIEPKQAEYMRKMYGIEHLISPADVYGTDYFKQTRGDFFPDNKIFGGMWDYLQKDSNGNIVSVLEMKTTKRAEDWQRDIPEYYAIQASLYAYLLGIEKVVMVVSFLEDKDYTNPQLFEPSAENTAVISFDWTNRYPQFEGYFQQALAWWDKYVSSGISPQFDEKADAEILKCLRTYNIEPQEDMSEIIERAEKLKDEVEPLNKELKALSDAIKRSAIERFRDGDTKVSLQGMKYCWSISKSTSTKIDKEALKQDGLLDKYLITEESYRMTVK